MLDTSNSSKSNLWHISMVLMCFLLNFNDGIDVLLVSFSSTSIINEFALSKGQMGFVFSVGLIGITLGALLLAPQADRWGRKKIFIIATLLCAIGMWGVSFANSYTVLLIWRLVTGLGIGGVLPAMSSMASESSTEKYKDFSVGFVQAGWPVGAILIGVLSSYWIPTMGWRFGFKVAAIFSSCVTLLIFIFMDDSFSKQKTINQNKQDRFLFLKSNRSSTIRIWMAAFFGFMTLYTVMSWVPTIASEAGLPFELATYVGIILNVGAAIGSSSIGWIGSKYGLQKTQSNFMMIAFVLMVLFAFLPSQFILILIVIGLLGVFVQGGFNGIWPILARMYPNTTRVTGIGYAVGVGRIGAIIGPALFGIFSDLHFSTTFQFILFSIPLLIMGFLIKKIAINQ